MPRSLWILFSAILLLAACTGGGELRPEQPTVTPQGTVTGQPILVTFAELQEAPEVYLNQLIRVSGSYALLPPVVCQPHSGPGASWALVANNLRMDALGFESSLSLVAEGLELTVDGIWRQYVGPLGCGKEPDLGVAWYLESARIVQPNPLVRDGDPAASNNGGGALPPLITVTPGGGGVNVPTATPSGGVDYPGLGTPTVTATALQATTPTATTVGLPAGTPTLTPAATNTPLPTTTGGSGASRTPTPTPSRTPTAVSGATGTATATRTPAPTATQGIPPTPLSTSTPNGYPDPPTPTPTPSPTGGY